MSFLNRGKNPKQHPEVKVELSLALATCFAGFDLPLLDLPAPATSVSSDAHGCRGQGTQLNRSHLVPVFADFGVDLNRDFEGKRCFHQVPDRLEDLVISVFKFKNEFVMDVEEHFCF